MILEGKAVIVSGVGEGLGREVAEIALREGAKVVLGARNEGRLAKLAEQLDDSGGGRVAFRAADIADPAQCQALVQTAVDRFGAVDGLVNVAALDSTFGGIQGANWEEWRQSFDINVFGSLQVTQAAVEAMKDRGGSVVFVGSQSMYLSQVPQMAYAASKAALQGAIAHLVPELGPLRIRVNTVIPSWMWGPPVEGYVSHQASTQGVDPEEVRAGLAARFPLGEIPSDGDVAEVIAFFLSDRARMVTGQALLVNGGEYLR